MAAISQTLRGMKSGPKKLCFAALPLAGLLLVASAQMQSVPMGSGTNLSSVMYFEPPNEQQVKVRLSGAQMSPLPGATYDVTKLKIETYNRNGSLAAVAQAPQCIYAPFDAVARSAGHLELDLDEGKIHIRGEGFLWQQNDSLLIISNQQHTVIKMGNWKLTPP
jgi:hypothetical protein